jgi:hypothetical protein
MNTIIKFNDAKEFVAELQLSRLHMPEPILRVTKSFEQSGAVPSAFLVSVIATFEMRTRIVRLNRYCGEHWPHADQKAVELADSTIKVLEDAAKELEVEVRAGVIESTDLQQ